MDALGQWDFISEARKPLWHGIHFIGLRCVTFYGAAVHLRLEKEMAVHSSTLAWKISWMEEPGRLQSMGLQRVRHD